MSLLVGAGLTTFRREEQEQPSLGPSCCPHTPARKQTALRQALYHLLPLVAAAGNRQTQERSVTRIPCPDPTLPSPRSSHGSCSMVPAHLQPAKGPTSLNTVRL